MSNPVRDALRKERGLAGKIADACGITREAVWLWTRVPAERVLVVERVTGLSRHLLRPDIYPSKKYRARR